MKKYNITMIAAVVAATLSGQIFAGSAPVSPKDYHAQAEAIYSRMDMSEKVGQLLLPTYNLLVVSKEACKAAMHAPSSPASDEAVIKSCGLEQIEQYKIGAVLEDGGPFQDKTDLASWQRINRLAKQVHDQGVTKDPLLLTGNDAIHGNSHVAGAVIFPHNIGLGVSHDSKIVRSIGEIVAQDSLYSGFNWVYMPTVAVAQDIRWGRTYESFAQVPSLVKAFSKAYIEGYQSGGAMATVKHFIGDGATDYGIDEGNATFSGTEKEFWDRHGQGYDGAVEANVLSMMASYNGINGKRMHFGGPWDSINDFKNNRGFNGFVVSDYNGVTRAEYFEGRKDRPLPEIFADAINKGGIDMFMVGGGDVKDPFASFSPYYCKNIGDAADALKTAVDQKLMTEQQLKNAVVRILSAKLAVTANMKNVTSESYSVLQKKERALALKAAEKSLVLLQNNNTLLPMKKNQLKYLFVAGPVDDIGTQNGGWTINWQGQKGNQYFSGVDKVSSGATTVLEGVKKYNKDVKVLNVKEIDTIKDISPENSLVLTVVAEPPYAEYMGDIGNNDGVADLFYDRGAKGAPKDRENEYMPEIQSKVLQLAWVSEEALKVQRLHKQHVPVVTVIYSGRPVVVTEALENSDTVIAAFLPGTLGGDAIANAMFGEYFFKQDGESNTLTFPWPKTNADVQNRFKEGYLHPIGYGLATTKK